MQPRKGNQPPGTPGIDPRQAQLLELQRQQQQQIEAVKFGKEQVKCSCGCGYWFPIQVFELWKEKITIIGQRPVLAMLPPQINTIKHYCINCMKPLDIPKPPMAESEPGPEAAPISEPEKE